MRILVSNKNFRKQVNTTCFKVLKNVVFAAFGTL